MKIGDIYYIKHKTSIKTIDFSTQEIFSYREVDQYDKIEILSKFFHLVWVERNKCESFFINIQELGQYIITKQELRKEKLKILDEIENW